MYTVLYNGLGLTSGESASVLASTVWMVVIMKGTRDLDSFPFLMPEVPDLLLNLLTLPCMAGLVGFVVLRSTH